MRKVVILLFLFSCSNSMSDKISENKLIGTWKNLSLEVKVADPDTIMSVPEGEWERILRIKPIRTVFSPDYTYVSTYRHLNDSIFMESRGAWILKGDSLMMVYHGDSTWYKVQFDGEVAEFTGYVDWDEDQLKDDLYFGRQQKVN